MDYIKLVLLRQKERHRKFVTIEPGRLIKQWRNHKTFKNNFSDLLKIFGSKHNNQSNKVYIIVFHLQLSQLGNLCMICK